MQIFHKDNNQLLSDGESTNRDPESASGSPAPLRLKAAPCRVDIFLRLRPTDLSLERPNVMWCCEDNQTSVHHICPSLVLAHACTPKHRPKSQRAPPVLDCPLSRDLPCETHTAVLLSFPSSPTPLPIIPLPPPLCTSLLTPTPPHPSTPHREWPAISCMVWQREVLFNLWR